MLLDCSFQTHSSWQNQHGHTLNLQGRKRTWAHFHHSCRQFKKKWINPSHNPNLYSIALIKHNKTVYYCCIVCAQRVVMKRRRLLEGKAGRTSRHQSPDTSGGLSIPVFDDSRGFIQKISKISHHPQAWPRDPVKKLGKNFAWDVVRQHPQQHVCVHGLKIGWNLSETVDMWAALYSERTLRNHPCGIERLNCFLTAVETSLWPWALAFKTTRLDGQLWLVIP